MSTALHYCHKNTHISLYILVFNHSPRDRPREAEGGMETKREVEERIREALAIIQRTGSVTIRLVNPEPPSPPRREEPAS